MAVSTVSSLTESYLSGVSLANGDGVLNKDKPATLQEVGTPERISIGQGDTNVVKDQSLAKKTKDEMEEESSELTEQSDDEGRMLEVHD